MKPGIYNMPAPLLKHIAIRESGCWEWTGSLSSGYGQVTYQGRHCRVHRLVYSQAIGEIKHGFMVLHHCDNKLCVNPEHLYQGTCKDNVADMHKRGRWSHPWRARTHCSKGHAYPQSGVKIVKGGRECRQCRVEWKRAYRLKLRGASL